MRLRKEKTGRRKKLLRIAMVLALVIVLAVAAIYIYLNNTLTAALMQSLRTFKMVSVTYSSVEADSVELNITFILENPTDFSITVEAIIIFFSVDERDIGGVTVSPTQNLPARENTSFYFIRYVTDEDVLDSIRNQTYKLSVEGKIVGYTRYLFVYKRMDRRLAFAETVTGIPQVKT